MILEYDMIPRIHELTSTTTLQPECVNETL